MYFAIGVRADEADRGDVGVLEDAVDRHLVAVDDVEAAVGQAGLLEQLGDEHRRRRILLARLEDERVAARQRVGEHPHRHHRREVERRDAGDDAERLLDASTRRRRSRPARCSRPSSGCGMPHANSMFSSPRATSPSASDSTLPCSADSSEAISLRFADDQLAHVEHHLGPPRQVRRPPRRERRLGDGDRVIDLADRREVDRGRLLPRRRVPDDARPRPTSRRRPCRRSSARSDS